MTNKEAKEKLYMEWQKFLEDNIDYAGVSEAYKMAFKALEQEPCEDAISRQEVLDLIADYDLSMGQVVRSIHALPSVTPQESKTGHWITWKEAGNFIPSETRFECSVCHDAAQTLCNGLDLLSSYCPNCGAKMVEPQESEG